MSRRSAVYHSARKGSAGVFSLRSFAGAVAVTTALPLACVLSIRPAAGARPRPAAAPGEVIVQFKSGASELVQANVLGRVRARVKEHLRQRHNDDPGVVRAVTDELVDEAVARLQADPAVAFAEPNWVVTHAATSNDPYYTGGSLWGTYGPATSPANTYGSNASGVWATGSTGSKAVYVGVIDEGVQITHPDLQANIWSNPFDPVDGVDNDGNGYVDDTHGWDFVHRDNSVYDAGEDSHGTHVAGTIGATGGNGMGVAGINWNVTLISTKFLGPNGGYTSDAVKAIDYYVDLKVRHGLNIVAVNNSWGGGGYSQALHDAIIRAAKQNILFVAAAGNGGADGVGDNNDATPNYPSNYDTTVGTSTETAAGYDGVIAVAAIDSLGRLASFSNSGAMSVDLGAPGVSIYSTLPTNAYGAYSGTSMATPHVTGAAALYAATHPGENAATIREALLNAAVPTASLSGRTVTGGRLQINPNPSAAQLMGLRLDAAGVTGGAAVTGTVILDQPAPASGTTVTLTSNAAAAAVPAEVAVLPGMSTATFSVKTAAVAANTAVTVTASSGNVSRSAGFTVLARTPSGVSFTSNPVAGGKTDTATVTLTGAAPAAGITVVLSSTHPAATVPASVLIPAGAKSASFPVTTVPVASTTAGTITAACNGVTKTASLTVRTPGVLSLTLSPATVVGGVAASATVTLDAPAGPGGVPVTLTSSNVALAQPVDGGGNPVSSVSVPMGIASTRFMIRTTPVAVTTPVTLTASAGGFSKSVTLSVAPVATSGLSLVVSPNPVRGGTAAAATITLAAPAGPGGVTVALNSSAGAVAYFASSTGSPLWAGVMVPPGSSTVTVSVRTTPQTTTKLVTLYASTAGVNQHVVLSVTP